MGDTIEHAMTNLSLATHDQVALPNTQEVGVLPPNQTRLTSKPKGNLIERLPEEIVVAIFELLPVPDLVRCRQVCLIRSGNLSRLGHLHFTLPSYR